MRWMVALLIASVLAGCAEGGGDATPEHETHEAHAMHVMQNVTFFDASTEVMETFTGAFDPQDTTTVQAAFATAGLPVTNVRSHDITDLIPVGVPAFVEIEIEGRIGVLTWLAADDFAAIWTSDCGACEGPNIGTTWSGAVLNTGQQFAVNAWYNNDAPATTNEYTITVRVSAAPDRLPSGIVVEVDMPQEGSHILFESVEGDVPDVMVFGPDDVYVRTLPGGSSAEMYLEDGLVPGAYVFLPVGHGTFYKLRSGSDIPEGEVLDVQARILEQIIETGGPQPAGDGGSYEVEMARQPLQTGILVFGGLHNGASIRSAGPEGFVMETSVNGPGFGFGAFTQTPMGHDALRPGTYTISWETPGNDGSVQVQEFFTLYGR